MEGSICLLFMLLTDAFCICSLMLLTTTVCRLLWTSNNVHSFAHLIIPLEEGKCDEPQGEQLSQPGADSGMNQ